MMAARFVPRNRTAWKIGRGELQPHPAVRSEVFPERLCRRLNRMCTPQLGILAMMICYLTGSVYMNYSLAVQTYAASQRIAEYEQSHPLSPEDILKLRNVEPGVKRIVMKLRSAPKNATSKIYRVVWFNPPPYLKLRPNSLRTSFTRCEFSNCRMSLNYFKSHLADVVLFDGRWVPKTPRFKRPRDQVWVFAAHESPATFFDQGEFWSREPWVNSFNWTMTYDRKSEIYLPYGELAQTKKRERNYLEIAKSKSKAALIIVSHCMTRGRRLEYVKALSKYVEVDVLGRCGTPWDCGKRYVHDECFQLLNTTYKFYLSFENALCRDYFSEKFFDNYNYDVIQVTRGGLHGNSRDVFPSGTHIPTDAFQSVEEMGSYLKHLDENDEEYAKFLESKDQYTSIGYTAVYERALCTLCERMNKQETSRSSIHNMEHWAFDDRPCMNADDLDDKW